MEIYDVNKRTWVPYVQDSKKWEKHFIDVFKRRVTPDRKGPYTTGSSSSTYRDHFKVELVTPQAQGLEMAKSELKRLKESASGTNTLQHR